MAHRKQVARRPPRSFDGAWAVLVAHLEAYTSIDGELVRPWMAFWLDPASESGLGLEVSRQRSGIVTAEGYALARSAASGVAPPRILCADDVTAAAVRAAVPGDIPVEVGEIEALRDLGDRLAAATVGDLGQNESLLASERIDQALIPIVLAAAGELHAQTRDSGISCLVPVMVDFSEPTLPSTVALLTPGGHLILCDGPADLAAFDEPAGDDRPRVPHGMLVFLTERDVGPEAWRVALDTGCLLPAAGVVPDVFFTDRDGIMRPLTEADVVRTIACARALTEWLSTVGVTGGLIEIETHAADRPVKARVQRLERPGPRV